ncbi:MAG: S-adenosylmethionine:tRNA ribosyltransferase-isomerase [Tannerella sp.]|jgi:S-adenosylmethionine:tRNA ribosyltransferase-isomerase|nr:S-adenosylmethionine:tRNA ribosyltransferase-isomerase [Tannerella sp.]
MAEKKTDDLSSIQQINIEEYDYPLSDEQIAKFPLQERDKSKLLLYRNGEVSESIFDRLPDLLPEKSLIIFNNTRVIRARLLFSKNAGAQIEIFCLEPENPHDYAMNFQSHEQCRWTCLVGNSKRWKEGPLKRTLIIENKDVTLTAERILTNGQTHLILFKWDNPSSTFADVLDAAGVLPIPPYLHRDAETSDLQTYQTVYSKINGSVAAPTAGLHFTPEVLTKLESKGFKREELTLHVGAGTFKPVQTETIGGHEMHTEFISVNRSAIANILENTGHIVAIGTTSARTLESLYYIGAFLAHNPDATPDRLAVKQWTPYENKLPQITTEKAIQNILKYLDKNNLDKLITSTQIMIAPGYEFHIVNNMITNFHQPKSTLLLLVSAFVKDNWKKIYDYALTHDFRFLSYGDSSLLINQTGKLTDLVR